MNESKVDDDLSKMSEEIDCDTTEDEDGYSYRRRHRQKVVYSVHLCVAYLICGWVLAQIGSALLDLQIITGQSLEHVSLYQTFYNTGYLFGSILTGLIHRKVDRFLSQSVSILWVAAGLAVVPWCSDHLTMVSVHFAIGIGCGMIDSVVNAEMMSVWGNQGLSFMQAMHFSYAAGGILSPIVTAQFLATKRESFQYKENPTTDTNVFTSNESLLFPVSYRMEWNDTSFHSANLSYDLFGNNSSGNINNSTTESDYLTQSRVYIAYSISAGLCFIIAIMFMFLYFKIDQANLDVRKNSNSVLKRTPLKRNDKIAVLVVMGTMAAVYIAVEESFSGFLNAFCVTHLDWSSSNGSYATSIFYGLFGFGRLLAILWVKYINPQKILGWFCGILVLVFVILIICGIHKVHIMIWILSAVTGLVICVIYPTIFTWTENSFFPVNGRISGYFNFTSGLGGMVNPVVIGTLMDEVSPLWYTYVLTGEALFLCLLYGLGIILTRRISSYIQSQKNAVPDDDVL